MLLLVILMAAAEAVGMLSIMPFLKVLGRPAVIQENGFLRTLWNQFDFNETPSFIFALGIASIVLVIGSSIFKTVTLHIVNRFVHFLRHSISEQEAWPRFRYRPVCRVSSASPQGVRRTDG